MKDRHLGLRGDAGDLGDISPAIFREQLHRLADWIADYRETIETLPVAPDAKPGAITGALPKQAPEEGEPVERIFTDIESLIVPGMVHWGHSGAFHFSIGVSF
jgi:aromatic-L-amino-acid decarboxylase